MFAATETVLTIWRQPQNISEASLARYIENIHRSHGNFMVFARLLQTRLRLLVFSPVYEIWSSADTSSNPGCYSSSHGLEFNNGASRQSPEGIVATSSVYDLPLRSTRHHAHSISIPRFAATWSSPFANEIVQAFTPNDGS